MPVRKVHNRGNNIIGKFPSRTMGRMISFESAIERDFLFISDYEPNITFIEEQPFTIEYLHKQKMRRYTPDFHLIRRDVHVVVDCKPSTLVNTPENQIKFVAADEFCEARIWYFEVVTDVELRSGFRLQNIKQLTRNADYFVRPEVKGWVHALLLTRSSPMTIREIEERVKLDPPFSSIPIQTCLLHMAFHHEITIPLDHALISAESLVYVPSNLPTT